MVTHPPRTRGLSSPHEPGKFRFEGERLHEGPFVRFRVSAKCRFRIRGGLELALGLAEAGHDVTVVTRSEGREAIEQALGKAPRTFRLNFIYFDVPRAIRWQMRGPLHFHYL